MSTKKLKINKKSLKNAKTLPYIYSRFGLDFGGNLGKKMLYNVPAVTDVFLRPMRKNAKHFYGRKKMWWRKTVQRAKPEHGFS